MFNISKSTKHLRKIFHIGVRDFCKSELHYAQKMQYPVYDDMKIYGLGFKQCFAEITNQLSDRYYLSIDVDGLDPSFCPNTGTPVPGGIHFSDLKYALKCLNSSGKTLIGFDVCETGPSAYDANVAARIISLCCALFL